MLEKFKKSKEPAAPAQTTVELAAAPKDGKPDWPQQLRAGFKHRPKCCRTFFKFLFILLDIITIFHAIAVIIVMIMAAVATKLYDKDQSDRLVAHIIVAVTAAITIAICVYALIAVFRRRHRAIHVAAIVLLILALIQAIIAGSTIKVSEEDKSEMARSLASSFKRAKNNSPRQVKLWAVTQNSLNCCGLYGPDDYRKQNSPTYFPPDVPISCCPNYDPSRSDLVQETEKQRCKAKKEYFQDGCKYSVLDLHVANSILGLYILISLICSEVVLSIIGFILHKKQKDKGLRSDESKSGPSSK